MRRESGFFSTSYKDISPLCGVPYKGKEERERERDE
jgi:hypothetical protein